DPLARVPRHEGRARAGAPGDPLEELSGRELCVALDEELGRLPEHCRAPLVLCCLEGATRDEAARRLGWTLATLKRRLARGRALLQDRLARRGFRLTEVLAAALLTEQAARAVVPRQLGQTTARLATLAGQNAGAVPARVGALARTALASTLSAR